jgi:hypothetical protein
MDFVAGRNRVPRPPTGKMAFLTGDLPEAVAEVMLLPCICFYDYIIMFVINQLWYIQISIRIKAHPERMIAAEKCLRIVSKII